MRIVPISKYLLKCNINSSTLCDFCIMYVETNNHLFRECQRSRGFCTEFGVFLNAKQIDIKFDYEMISFGYME